MGYGRGQSGYGHGSEDPHQGVDQGRQQVRQLEVTLDHRRGGTVTENGNGEGMNEVAHAEHAQGGEDVGGEEFDRGGLGFGEGGEVFEGEDNQVDYEGEEGDDAESTDLDE